MFREMFTLVSVVIHFKCSNQCFVTTRQKTKLSRKPNFLRDGFFLPTRTKMNKAIYVSTLKELTLDFNYARFSMNFMDDVRLNRRFCEKKLV